MDVDGDGDGDGDGTRTVGTPYCAVLLSDGARGFESGQAAWSAARPISPSPYYLTSQHPVDGWKTRYCAQQVQRNPRASQQWQRLPACVV